MLQTICGSFGCLIPLKDDDFQPTGSSDEASNEISKTSLRPSTDIEKHCQIFEECSFQLEVKEPFMAIRQQIIDFFSQIEILAKSFFDSCMFLEEQHVSFLENRCRILNLQNEHAGLMADIDHFTSKLINVDQVERKISSEQFALYVKCIEVFESCHATNRQNLIQIMEPYMLAEQVKGDLKAKLKAVIFSNQSFAIAVKQQIGEDISLKNFKLIDRYLNVLQERLEVLNFSNLSG